MEKAVDKKELTSKNNYGKISKIGYGSFGCVYKVQLKSEDETKFFALKKFFLDNLKNEKGNFVQRQYDLLKRLSHPNLIEAVEYLIYKGNECIVFNYYSNDLLKTITSEELELKEDTIRKLMKQILEGVAYLHENGILHRDLKPDNILISFEGCIKITDFDLAREIDYQKPMSRGVATIYYRPPEIFFGETHYDFAVDMWSVGCILAELILREPIFKGRNEIDVLFKIEETMGSPDEEIWPGCSDLPNYVSFTTDKTSELFGKLFSGKISESCFDLLKNLLQLDPKKRLTAKQALEQPFFKEDQSTNYETLVKNLNLK